MTSTYDLIATQTLTANQANGFIFSSIPQTYTDLVLVVNAATPSGGWIGLCSRVNNDSSGAYFYNYMYSDGAGGTPTTDKQNSQTFGNDGAITSGLFGTSIWQFARYTNTTSYKSYMCRSGISASGFNKQSFIVYQSTSAINQIQVFHPSVSIATGSMATLYGILCE